MLGRNVLCSPTLTPRRKNNQSHTPDYEEESEFALGIAASLGTSSLVDDKSPLHSQPGSERKRLWVLKKEQRKEIAKAGVLDLAATKVVRGGSNLYSFAPSEAAGLEHENPRYCPRGM